MSTSMDECRSGCGCGSPLDEDTGRCVECGADSRPKRGYWYEFNTLYCPVCGSETTYKNRVYDRPRPDGGGDKWKSYRERHKVHEAWDYCDW